MSQVLILGLQLWDAFINTDNNFKVIYYTTGHKLAAIISWRSYLVEFELKPQNVAEGERLTHVGLDERQKELILVWTILVYLQNYVQHAIGV